MRKNQSALQRRLAAEYARRVTAMELRHRVVSAWGTHVVLATGHRATVSRALLDLLAAHGVKVTP